MILSMINEEDDKVLDSGTNLNSQTLSRVVRVGTRGSPLALAQSRIVIDLLRRKTRSKKVLFRIETIRTKGDENIHENFSPAPSNETGKDSFTKSIDSALINGDIDIAVHSLKDVPVEGLESDKIEIAAFPKRGSPYDTLISKTWSRSALSSLPTGARIGTSSARRAVQLMEFRPDFRVVEIHGNIETRLNKLRSGDDLDAIVLAEVGLKRLKLTKAMGRRLPMRIMLPAVGQGCLAVVARKHDDFHKSIVSAIDDKETRLCVIAERAFSRKLGGGCNLPLAAFAKVRMTRPRKLTLEGLVAAEGQNGKPRLLRSAVSGVPDMAESLGMMLASRLGHNSTTFREN
jgi:hydroxymethylbilane synthase